MKSKNLLWSLLLLIQVIIFFILSKISYIVDLFNSFFEWQKSVHIKVFSGFGFSFGDFLYSLMVLIIIYWVIKIIISKTKKLYFGYILISANIFYFLYQIFWGMLYFQTPISEKLPKKEFSTEDYKVLIIKYLELCKTERQKLNEDKNGVFVIKNLDTIKGEIIALQEKLPKKIIDKKPVHQQSIKPSLFAKYLNFTGILGYYNPFTAEAQYNPNLPNTDIPFTVAHETAHQMGFAREQEANFMAYLIGIQSNNSEIRYSVYYFTLMSLLNAINQSEPKFVEEILDQFSPAMKRDRAEKIRFREQNESWLGDVFAFTNDWFLKSNQQEGSITYSYFVDLLMRYENL